MQEEIENKTVTLMINSSKLTARTLSTAFSKFLRYTHGKLKEKRAEQEAAARAEEEEEEAE